jgi:putative ABC transport system permease protein
METILKDLRYGVRAWLKAPGFTFVVVLTLACGIGANTTVFSVINTLFLNPLPVDRPAELVAVRTVDAGARSNDALPISYPNLQDFRGRNQVFEQLAGHSAPTALTLLDGDTPQRLFGELVTGDYFQTLGIRPERGRFFLPEEDAIPGAMPVLVVAHGAWQRRFGGSPEIVGRALRINGVAFSVIGVAPAGFKGVNAVFGPDVWIPAMMTEAVMPAQMRDWLRNRSALGFRGVARLKPATTAAQAGANLAQIAAVLEREYPDANRGRSVAVEPLSRAALLAPGRMSAATISLILLAIPGFILLIACSNVANLLLARAADRRHEIAVRLALGSGRRRLIRQLLTESLLLACVSGAVGFALAYAGSRLLWSFRPPEVATNLIDLDVNGTVFLFTAIVSLTTGGMFGLVPAWQSTRTDVARTLNEEARSVGQHRRRITLGKSLLVGQVALSLVSLVTAGLLLRSLQAAYLIDPGFETKRLAIAMISPGQAGYPRVRSEQFYRDAAARLEATPGVVHATWATQLPLFARPSRGVTIEGREERDRGSAMMAVVNAIDVRYFDTTGIALTRGRDFTAGDRDGTLPVAIVNETLAARAWPSADAIGRRLRLGGDDVLRQVVGVARTANYESLGEPPQPCVYLPLRQQFSDAAVLYVRTEADPAGILAVVQRQVRSLDAHIEVGDVRTIQKIVGQALFGAGLGVGLLGVFGMVALALASLGLYGAMAHAVRQRRREIGVRMALGARRAEVLRLVLRQGLTVVGVGMAFGAGLSMLIGKALSGVLFGVTAIDPISLGVASLGLALATAAACYLPARRASRLDPLTALRDA